MNLWIKVKAGQMKVEDAIAKLESLGATRTQTYRRLVRFKKKQ